MGLASPGLAIVTGPEQLQVHIRLLAKLTTRGEPAAVAQVEDRGFVAPRVEDHRLTPRPAVISTPYQVTGPSVVALEIYRRAERSISGRHNVSERNEVILSAEHCVGRGRKLLVHFPRASSVWRTTNTGRQKALSWAGLDGLSERFQWIGNAVRVTTRENDEITISGEPSREVHAIGSRLVLNHAAAKPPGLPLNRSSPSSPVLLPTCHGWAGCR